MPRLTEAGRMKKGRMRRREKEEIGMRISMSGVREGATYNLNLT
jgi:hypothetical protein